MNIETGEIITHSELKELLLKEGAVLAPKFVEVKRDLSKYEELDKAIRLYAPCGCGSGKKFKFCCHKPAS